MRARRAPPIGVVAAVLAIAIAALLGGPAVGLYVFAVVVAALALASWWLGRPRAWSWRTHGGGLLASALLLAGGILVAGGGGGADRYRYFVATPDPVTFARIAPYSEAAAGEVSYSSTDPLWVICWVEGPRDDRYWYRLEDGTFLPEDVIFPERRDDSSTPPRC